VEPVVRDWDDSAKKHSTFTGDMRLDGNDGGLSCLIARQLMFEGAELGER